MSVTEWNAYALVILTTVIIETIATRASIVRFLIPISPRILFPVMIYQGCQTAVGRNIVEIVGVFKL
ncbi:MAG TPA: hypothetical protein VEL11_18940 [Candidatus Bathyarchaeia archaeon]|nr:hypothetical protein [Candidatus Bathyarchaeia archaeon]